MNFGIKRIHETVIGNSNVKEELSKLFTTQKVYTFINECISFIT